MKTVGFLPRILATLVATYVTVSTPASGTIIGGSVVAGGPGATFTKLTMPFSVAAPPNTVGRDTFQANHLYGFDEAQNIHLSAALTVDTAPIGASTTIAAGKGVDSHYIFFDPVDVLGIDGYVDFDGDIVAIISSTGLLLASDFLGKKGVTYLSPGFRGLEPDDFVTISGTRQIRFNTWASSPGDYVRVLTESSAPEPGTIGLLGAGLGFLAWQARKARQRVR